MTLHSFAWLPPLLAAMFLFAVSGQAPAAAQGDPAYLAEYKAYSAAIDAGDREAAVRHGYAAWQAAEEALGDHELTGILAFNYGQLVIFTDAEAALSALERANALFAAKIVELSESDLRLFMAYAKLVARGERRNDINDVRKLLNEQQRADVSITAEAAKIWLHIAINDFTTERYFSAKLSAEAAENALKAALPEDYSRRAQAIIIGGAATLVPKPRSINEIQHAHNEFGRAMELFPPQKGIDNFNPVFAEAYAWDGAAYAALDSMNLDDFPDHEGADPDDPTFAYPQFIKDEKTAAECQIEWEQWPIQYPSEQARDAHIGSVIAGYNLPNDRPTDIRILAEVPSKGFGGSVQRNIHRWRLASPPIDDPACRKNRIVRLYFTGTRSGRIFRSGG